MYKRVTSKCRTTDNSTKNRPKQRRKCHRFAKLKELQADTQANACAAHLILPNRTQSPPTTPTDLQNLLLLIKLFGLQLFNSKRQLTFDKYCQVNTNKLKTTGEIIREQREKKELLLRQVAAKLDIDTAILSKIERGERKATREQIAKLADILDLKKDDLLIQYLSENIAYEIADDDLAKQALKVAEKKVDYLKKNRK